MKDLDKEINELIKELGIKKILVAERNPDFLFAAHKYFLNIQQQGISIDFSMTEEEAKKKIRESFNKGKAYGLVMSDYKLDGKEGGLGVINEAIRHGIFGTLNLYEKTNNPDNPHKTHQAVPGMNKETLSIKKDDDACWRLMAYLSLMNLNKEEYMESLIKTGEKVGGKPVLGHGRSRNLYKFVMRTYNNNIPLEEKASITSHIRSRFKTAFFPDYKRTVKIPDKDSYIRFIAGMRNMKRGNAH